MAIPVDKSQLYQSLKARAPKGVSFVYRWNHLTPEQELYNHRLNDLLDLLSSYDHLIPLDRIHESAAKLREECARSHAFQSEPDRFSGKHMKEAFCNLEISFVSEGKGGDDFVVDRVIFARLDVRRLSPKEVGALEQHFDGQLDQQLQTFTWAVDRIRLDSGISSVDLESWIAMEYRMQAWLELNKLLPAWGADRIRMPIHLSWRWFCYRIFGSDSRILCHYMGE